MRRPAPEAAPAVPVAPVTEVEPETPTEIGPEAPVDQASDGEASDGEAAAAEGEPPKPPAIRRSALWARVCVTVGAVLVLLSAGTVAAFTYLTHRYERAVARDELLAPGSRDDSGANAGRTISGPLNYLLIGSDFKARSPGEGQRSDTIIIVHIPATLDRAYLISVPRDLRVEIPSYAPTGFRGDETKINAAFQYGGGGRGGAQLLSKTLTSLMGVKFNGAAIINFDGFKKAVDVLGGVQICVEQEVSSNHMGYDKFGNLLELYADEEGRIQGLPEGGHAVVYEPGCRKMPGALALDYSRIRYGLPNGDYDRQRNQQQFLRSVLTEGLRQGVVTNPVKFDGFLRAVGSALTVDTGGDSLTDLIFTLRNISPSTLTGLTIPSYPDMIGGVSYVLPDALATSLYKAVQEDSLDTWAVENPSWVNHL